MTHPELEFFTLMIEATDKEVANSVMETFPEDEVSSSSNFIGSVELAVFFSATSLALRPMAQILREVLAFLAARRDAYKSAKIVIGGESVELDGYSPDEAERILDMPAFKKLQQKLGR